MATVIITGGSRGIGAEAVRQFAARGDKVYFLYEKEHGKAKSVAEETGAIAICCDVSDGQTVKGAFAQIQCRHLCHRSAESDYGGAVGQAV